MRCDDTSLGWAGLSSDASFQTLNQIGIDSHSGNTCLKYLQKLCSTSGDFPSSFMLTDGLDDFEPRPLASGGFADTYRATYKGQPAVAKAFKVTFVNDLENMHKVGGLISEHVV